jgi:hypothetical protein
MGYSSFAQIAHHIENTQPIRGKDNPKNDDDKDDDDNKDEDGSGGDDSSNDKDDDDGETNGGDNKDEDGNDAGNDDEDDNSGSDDNNNDSGGDDKDDDSSENDNDNQDDGGNDSGNDDDKDDSGGDSDNDKNPDAGSDDDNQDDGKTDDSGKDDENKEPEDKEEDQKEFEDDHQYYVGTVSANDGNSLVVDGSSFKGDSPWLKVLNSGMLLEAYGKWEEDSFIVQDVKILIPSQFAFYEGPAEIFGQGSGNIKAWTNTQKQLESIQSSSKTDNSVTLIAYFDGTTLSATPDIFPVPEGLEPGWVELTGKQSDNTIIWESVQSFP